MVVKCAFSARTQGPISLEIIKGKEFTLLGHVTPSMELTSRTPALLEKLIVAKPAKIWPTFY
jgi:hypothetical protein